MAVKQGHTGQSATGASQNSLQEIDIGQILRTLWRGKLIIALFSVLFILLGGYYAFVKAVPVYTARTTVVLDNRVEQIADIQSAVSSLSGDQVSVNTEVEVIKSRALAEKLVDALALDEDPEFNPELRPDGGFSLGKLISGSIGLVKRLISGPPPEATAPDPVKLRNKIVDNVSGVLSVSNIRQSYVFNITAVTTDPQKSALMADTLAQIYIQSQIETKFEATESSTQWLSERVAQLKIELETAEKASKEFNTGTDLVSPAALVALNRQIKDLRDRLSEARRISQTTARRIEELEAAAETGDVSLMVDVAADPTLLQISRGIRSTATRPTLAFRNRYNMIVDQARVEQIRASNQIDALESTIQLQEEKIARQSEDLVELQQFQREAEASRLIYEFFLNRLKEISVQQGVQQADSRILSQAVAPVGPSAPRKAVILVMSAMLGIFAGAGVVLGREFSQNTFREGDGLERKTGYTVIGQIPLIPARKRKNVLKYLTDKPTSAAAEAVRNLRTSILLSNLDDPPQVIMSTSSIPGEGKTTQSLALAQNLTGLDKKVLLIEGDIRRRVFAEYFEIENKKGLLAVLSGEAKLEDAVVFEPSLRADMLIGEKAKTNAADIFSSSRFGEFLQELRGVYDYIIIDTPPVLIVPDARVIAQSVDAVMYTVKWDYTTQRQVMDGLKAFENVGVRVAGLVLSQINPKGMKKYGLGDTYGAYGGGYYDN